MPLKNLCAAFALLFCALFANAADLVFHPKIALLGFSSSPANTADNKYGQAQISLPVSFYLEEHFSAHAEYFFAYSYFDKKKDFYDKLNQAIISFAIKDLEIKAGRDFLDLGLNPVIYFGHYIDKDLAVPSYFEGAFAKYAPLSFLEIASLAGKFDNKDLYGATLKISILKGFFFKTKEDLNNLIVYGASLDYISENFDINLLAAYNDGEKTKKHLGLNLTKDYKGKLFSGNISLKENNDFFNTKVSFGAEYLSPAKEDSLSYRPIKAYFDKGFIFGNINEGLETLTYKLAFNIMSDFIKDFNAEIKIYNFSATDKTLPYRDIANEIDFKLAYQYKKFAVNFIYGYLKTLDGFNNFANGFEGKKSINKLGLVFNFQL